VAFFAASRKVLRSFRNTEKISADPAELLLISMALTLRDRIIVPMETDATINQGSLLFPGLAATADGSEAVVWVETNITQGACAYPITPSTNMGGGYQLAVANGQRNLWGEPLTFLELESEHSSASTCEGFALAAGGWRILPPAKGSS
jgi:Pyruvate flavodoxin/ferredoxin oxidoreductase, thiamine diP-bdg